MQTMKKPVAKAKDPPRKLALQQDINKLKQKLRVEEGLHRALDRAFQRPLGALPRLPPHLPPSTLELLAEVAVLEEEVVRLEEQVVQYRQSLYQQALYTSASKKNIDNASCSSSSSGESVAVLVSPVKTKPRSKPVGVPKGTRNLVKTFTRFSDDRLERKCKPRQFPEMSPKSSLMPKSNTPQKPKTYSRQTDTGKVTRRRCEEKDATESSPNKVSEDIIKCLCTIYRRMSTSGSRVSTDSLPHENFQESGYRDPYHICSGFGNRDTGPYKFSFSIEASSLNVNRTSNCLFLIQRLRVLLEKLALVELRDLNHQEKLAFWINIYNSCMMNAILEHGIPTSPEIVELMQEATINVGGHSLNAITIEHFILRLPYQSKYISKGARKDEMAARSMFGLELSEALVTFALSCGNWSSPAVRVYTASDVDSQLEEAKREYLHASVGISTNETKLAIPKLLDWYLLDFAKDFESLLDWICSQLPSELGKETMKCLESAKSEPISHLVQVIPYDFNFRYLLRT